MVEAIFETNPVKPQTRKEQCIQKMWEDDQSKMIESFELKNKLNENQGIWNDHIFIYNLSKQKKCVFGKSKLPHWDCLTVTLHKTWTLLV